MVIPARIGGRDSSDHQRSLRHWLLRLPTGFLGKSWKEQAFCAATTNLCFPPAPPREEKQAPCVPCRRPPACARVWGRRLEKEQVRVCVFQEKKKKPQTPTKRRGGAVAF